MHGYTNIKRTLTLAVGCSLGMIHSAHAGIAELLLKKGVITQEEYQQLKDEAIATAPTVATTAPVTAAPTPAPATPSVSFAKGFAVTSIDGSYVAQVGTLMQFDVAGYNDEGNIDNNAGSNIRRGRLYLQGTALKDWQYKMEIELFGTTGTEVTDAYLRYNGFTPFTSTKPLAITAGHFKIPFSFEQLMADKDLSLMERSLPNALLKSRAPGVMVSTSSDHWTASAMGFSEQLYSNAPSNSPTTNTTANSQQDEGGGASTRVTWAPLIDDGELLHFGLSAQYQKPTQRVGGGVISFASRPESFTTNLRTLDTKTITGEVKDAKLYGAEFSGVFGPATLAAEYIRAHIDRDLIGPAGGDLTFAGWYTQASWMLTGEHRAYDADKGLFKGIVPMSPVGTGGYGAWEITARYSVLDLNDLNISGGRERNATLGLGWYANNYVRLSGNWVHVYEIDGGPFNGQSMNALQARLQFAY